MSRRGVVTTLLAVESEYHSYCFYFDRGYIPIDIAHVEDLTDVARDLGVAADELDLDTGLTEVGAHGEVGNSGDHGNGGGNVVEDTTATRLGEGETGEDHGGDEHHRADGL